MKIHYLALCASILASPIIAANAHAKELKVVASFSIIADLAKNVGGDHISVKPLVGPDGDAHTYEPKPDDAALIKNADVILVNGLNFEGFLDRLVETSGTKAPVFTVSDGVTPIRAEEEDHDEKGHDHAAHDHEKEGHHHHGIYDPHAWQSVDNAMIYVDNIVKAFCKQDADNCADYQNNGNAYRQKLVALNAEVKSKIGALPADKRVIITSHDAFGYFAHEYGLTFLAPEGVSTSSEASAADVAALIKQIKADKAAALFVENISSRRLMDQISKESGLHVGGELYSDALSKADGPASTYIDMMQHNVKTITHAIMP